MPIGSKSKKIIMSIADLAEKLNLARKDITKNSVVEQMRDFFDPLELPGLEFKILKGMRMLEEILLK